MFLNKNYNDWIKNYEFCFYQCKVMIVYFKTDWNSLVYILYIYFFTLDNLGTTCITN